MMIEIKRRKHYQITIYAPGYAEGGQHGQRFTDELRP